jgi:general secretion pathway protein L
MQLSLGQPSFPLLLNVVKRGGRWWWNELVNLLPEPFVAFLLGGGRPLLIIAPGPEGATLEFIDASHPTSASKVASDATDISGDMERFLSSHGLKRTDVDLGLRLPAECLFVRQLLLPIEARNEVDGIVKQDLANKTPFKAADIFHDYFTSDQPGGTRFEVWQWIVRREFVLRALSSLALPIESLSFVSFDNGRATLPVPVINLRREARADKAWSRNIGSLLCFAALLLALIGAGLKYWNQQATLDRLNTEISAAGGEAQRVRTLVDQLKSQQRTLLRLRLRKGQAPGMIDLWEEVTRILPQDTWLTELRLMEDSSKGQQQITLIGFSSAAPRLVGIIDGSPLLYDAALISPTAFDAAEGRERFAIQAKVRSLKAEKDAIR